MRTSLTRSIVGRVDINASLQQGPAFDIANARKLGTGDYLLIFRPGFRVQTVSAFSSSAGAECVVIPNYNGSPNQVRVIFIRGDTGAVIDTPWTFTAMGLE